MNLNQVIVRPLITEKTLNHPDKTQYGFIVHEDANKNQITQAVQTLFGVTVISVRVNHLKSTSIRTGRRRLPGKSATIKKAWVNLKKGQTISYEEQKTKI